MLLYLESRLVVGKTSIWTMRPYLFGVAHHPKLVPYLTIGLIELQIVALSYGHEPRLKLHQGVYLACSHVGDTETWMMGMMRSYRFRNERSLFWISQMTCCLCPFEECHYLLSTNQDPVGFNKMQKGFHRLFIASRR